MSRAFAITDKIIITPSVSVPQNQGNVTLMALIKPITNIANDHWIAQGYTSANAALWGLLYTSSKFYNENNFGSGNGAPVLTDWMWAGYTKATGSVKPRWHFHNLTAATAWSHVDDGSNVADGSGTISKFAIGGHGTSGTGMQGSIAAIAMWSSVLSDATIETACASAAALAASSPSMGFLLNQAATTTAVTDFTGHGSTQSSLTGTTVDSDDPPGFSYTLSSAPTVKVWDGSAEQTVTVKVWDGSAEQTVTLSSIT
jgi:hypothetical protein